MLPSSPILSMYLKKGAIHSLMWMMVLLLFKVWWARQPPLLQMLLALFQLFLRSLATSVSYHVMCMPLFLSTISCHLFCWSVCHKSSSITSSPGELLKIRGIALQVHVPLKSPKNSLARAQILSFLLEVHPRVKSRVIDMCRMRF